MEERWFASINAGEGVNDYRPPLKIVGIALIVVGALDIGWMTYCLLHRMSYSSSFNILAVVAGILLMRGGLRTASVVAYVSALMLSAFGGLLIILPILMPFDLLLAYLKLEPLTFGGALLFVICSLVFLGWVYARLTEPTIQSAIAESHPRFTSFWRRPKTGFLVGGLLIVVFTVLLGLMMHGATAGRAVAEARSKVGDDFKFGVTRLNMISSNGRTHVSAVVTAYNEREIKDVAVEWDQ
jgi:hypothetical protein